MLQLRNMSLSKTLHVFGKRCFQKQFLGDLTDMRGKYNEPNEAFTEDQLVSKDPIEQFEHWFQDVKKCNQIKEPNAMCLATANKSGRPTARFVLLKGYGKDGFTFFTNYGSRKGADLEENPQAALTFYWEIFNRSVRIEGPVTKVSQEESEKYFKRRPVQSQIGAAASEQSKIIPNRNFLVEKAKEIEKISENGVERPKDWGGYLVKPERIEFWQGQSDRLHDRICFMLADDKQTWNIVRLAP